MDQALPSQCSSTALPGYDARSGTAPPTAQTSLLEIAATALSERLMAGPDGVGDGTMLHVLPFQCSASVAYAGDEFPFALKPTAQTSLLATAATPRSALWVPLPGAFGVGTTLQLVPFQCSARVLALA
jgi:hypothetical protein